MKFEHRPILSSSILTISLKWLIHLLIFSISILFLNNTRTLHLRLLRICELRIQKRREKLHFVLLQNRHKLLKFLIGFFLSTSKIMLLSLSASMPWIHLNVTSVMNSLMIFLNKCTTSGRICSRKLGPGHIGSLFSQGIHWETGLLGNKSEKKLPMWSGP